MENLGWINEAQRQQDYTNEWMATRFQNMVVGEQLPDQGLPGVNGDMGHR